MKWIGIIGSGILLSGMVSAGVDLQPYKEKVRTILPEGWAAASIGDSLIIRRMDPVQGIANSSPGASAVKTAYRIKLSFSDRVDPEDYARMYIADKSARDAGRSKLRLPAYYDDASSLDIDEGRYAVKGDVSIECEMVLKRVRSMFTPYVAEKKPEKIRKPAAASPAQPRVYHASIQTVLSNYEFKNLNYARLNVDDVLQALDKRFYKATNQKIAPTIRYSGLSQQTREASVTLAVRSINAGDLLNMLCDMYDMSYTIKYGQIVISDD